MTQLTRRELIGSGLGALAAATLAASGEGGTSSPESSFHHDHVLGTSLDAWVRGGDAATVEGIVLDEIERLRRVFSTFDPESELSRLNRTAGPALASPDLLAVLREYETWGRLSGGACSGQLGALVALWAEAERRGTPPEPATLDSVARRIGRPGWRIAGEYVTRLGDPLNLNSVAKGYILQRAADAVRRRMPSLPGLLLDLGGDLGGWGGWHVGVQDPARPEENSAPLTVVRLDGRAAATSGGYQRGYTVGGRRHSHLLDPRTGRPAGEIASATVVAPNCVIANTLATTLCVLSVDEGLRLVRRVPGAECLLVTARGEQVRSPDFVALEQPAPDEKKDEKPKDDKKDWPAGHQVTVAVEIPKIDGGKRYRRPYVAVWVEDGEGKPVRTLTVWGKSGKWLPTMSAWWKIGKGDNDLVKAVTRATRAPGSYTVAWDGKDDKGKALPQGTYTVRVEVHREHGKHLYQSGKITCGTEAAKLTLEKNAELGETVVEFAKRK